MKEKISTTVEKETFSIICTQAKSMILTTNANCHLGPILYIVEWETRFLNPLFRL